MKPYANYRKMQPSEYILDEKWLANRLMYLWRMRDLSPETYSKLRLYEEEDYLRNLGDIDTIAFSQHMDAKYDGENHRWKENYFEVNADG